MAKPTVYFNGYRYWTVIKDQFPGCPGTVEFGPFGTHKEAVWRGEQECKAAAELFTDGRANLTVSVIKR